MISVVVAPRTVSKRLNGEKMSPDTVQVYLHKNGQHQRTFEWGTGRHIQRMTRTEGDQNSWSEHRLWYHNGQFYRRVSVWPRIKRCLWRILNVGWGRIGRWRMESGGRRSRWIIFNVDYDRSNAVSVHVLPELWWPDERHEEEVEGNKDSGACRLLCGGYLNRSTGIHRTF